MFRFTYIQFAVLLVLFWSCSKDFGVDESFNSTLKEKVEIASDFVFSTTQDVNISIISARPDGTIVENAIIDVFESDPRVENGSGVIEGFEPLFRLQTDADGVARSVVSVSSNTSTLHFISNTIGMVYYTTADVSESVFIDYSDLPEEESVFITSVASSRLKASTTNTYYYLGSYNNYGLPNYLTSSRDEISNDLLADINASFPEGTPLPQSHPQYLAEGNGANVSLVEDAEVWVTFVHEGAGWRNVLGYFHYPVGSEPTSAGQIDNMTIIFPNSSYKNSGGQLMSGDKVQLKYRNPQTNQFEDVFPANTVIGWFLLANGWNGSVTDGYYRHFSIPQFNIENDDNLKQHNVLLKDEARQLLLLGFEDVRRDVSGCDQDFNDAIFYVTASPFTAVNTADLERVDTPLDSDNDGISDVFDNYPNNEEKAFDNFYPSEDNFATLLYEDLWPHKGDYDFNDMVIDYNFNQVTNAQNKLVELESIFRLKAIGAGYHNAFAIQFPVSPSVVQSVEGQSLQHDWLTVNSNGTEQNQVNAVVPIFDDAFDMLPHPGTGNFVNTESTSPYVIPEEQYITVVFNTPVSIDDVGTPPYDPFIIVKKQRGVEVHLPGKEPTVLADPSFFGTGDDQSPPVGATYYHSGNYFPWAMNLPVEFQYPNEKSSIDKAYLKFNDWAESRGFNYMDWYTNKPGYRDVTHIYSR